MKVEEVAPLFTKSPKTIYRWAVNGKLPVSHDPAGGVQFERKRIMQILELMAEDKLQ